MTSYPKQSIKNKFYIENLGCAKNLVDAEVLIRNLKDYNLELVDSPDFADLIIVNTCGFINPAKEESIDVLLDFRNNYPEKKVVGIGCLTQRYFNDLPKLMPNIDGFAKNRNVNNAVDLVLRVLGIEKEDLDKKSSLENREPIFSTKGSAYVKIAEGCYHNCSFCAIPIIRGGLVSRTIDSILKEINFLLDSGVYELNLIAQDLAAFGTDRGKNEFLDLIKSILSINKKFVVRMLYIHPDFFPLEILDLCKNDERLLPYFDIPFQHASKDVLKGMNRKGSFKEYLDLIKKIRKELPNSIIRSTFMTGFPNENSDDFEILKEFIREAKLDWVGFFEYSREEDTKSYDMISSFKYKRSKKNAKKRRMILESIQEKITEENLQRFIDKDLEVIIEEVVEGVDLYLARAYMNAPEVDGVIVVSGEDLKVGDIVNCKILRVNSPDLDAVVI